MGYTLEQLQQMGATPGGAPSSPVPKKKYTYEELQSLGATPAQPEKKDGFLKSLVRPVATIVARPIQAAVEVLTPGDNTAAIDKFSKEKLGGYVAPVPQNAGDVIKDVGRAAQLVSYGVGGGAVKGAVTGSKALAPKVATLAKEGAKSGALFGAGESFEQGGADITARDFAAKTAGGAILGGAVGGALPLFGGAVKAVVPKSENLVSKTLGIGNSKGAKDFKRFNKGESMEEYLVRTGNINDPEKTMMKEFEKATQSRISGEQAMKEVPGIYNNEYVEAGIKGLLAKEKKIGIPGGDSKEIFDLAQKYQKDGGLSFWEANRVKQLYEKNVKLDFLKERAADSIQKANRIDQGIRQWQRNTAKKGGFTNLSDIMKQTQNARMVANELYKKSLKGDANKGFNLFDAVLLAGGNPAGLSLAIGRRLFSSDTVRTGMARAFAGKKSKDLITPKRGPVRDFFLNAPKEGTPKTTQGPITSKIKGGPTLYSSPKGSVSPNIQEAIDVSAVDLKNAVKPKAGVGANRKIKIKEALEGNQPFVNPSSLPKIDMGKKKKIGDVYKGLPVAKDAPKVASPKRAEPYIPDKYLPTIQYGKTPKGSIRTDALLIGGAGTAAGVAGGRKIGQMYNDSKIPVMYGKSDSPKKAEASSKPDIRKGFIHAENRGAVASGEDVYKVKGVTGDLGKYQVKPETLKDWSKPWLGKQMTPQEFLNDPEAQEEFMNQFEAIVNAYDLSPEDAAVIWHKGWGVLGDSRPREEKKKALRKYIDSKRDEASEYVETFMEGLAG